MCEMAEYANLFARRCPFCNLHPICKCSADHKPFNKISVALVALKLIQTACLLVVQLIKSRMCSYGHSVNWRELV